jgi:GntR family transcriptional regulator/MocR family aminotransferase
VNRASRAPSEKTTSRGRGTELDLSLDGVPRGRRALSLADALRRRIADGTLRPGTQLPSSRQLAHDHGVSRGLVVSVYEQLVAEGHLTADGGSGTSVADLTHDLSAPRRARIEVPAVAGMNPGQPDPALFPRREWQRAGQRALADLPDLAFAYGEPRGHLPLRSALRGYLGRTRGVDTDEDRILVTSGFAQCLNIVVQTFTRREGRAVIAVEDPGSAGAAAQLTWLGARVVPVRVDGRGIDVAELRRTDAQAVVVTPAHQYPTGVTLASERRHELVDWARSTGGVIVEDDYDAEYRYDRAPLTSLHALGSQHVIAAGSVSKSLSPSLRLGWMVAPDDLVPDLAAAKANADLGTSVLTQATLATFIDVGALDRHLRRTRTVYRRRRDRLIHGLGASELDVSGIAAGLHLVLALPPSSDAGELAEHARRLGFAAQPLDRYRHRPGPPGLVLGYAALPEHAIDSAAAALLDAIG